jgi:hypothetical protein
MRSRSSSQSGSVLILAMLVTLVILGVGLTAMWIASSEMKISGNITRRQECLYGAESGLERARSILATSASTWATLLTTATCSATEDDYTPGTPTTGTGQKGKILCDDSSPPLPMENIPLFEGTTLTNPGLTNMTYTIWIRNDDAEQAANVLLSNPPELDRDRRLVVHVEATGRDQLSFFAVEAVLAAPVVAVDEDYMGQHGGNAQGTHSGQGYIALPTP